MATRTPLPQYTSPSVNHIHKVCIRLVQIARIIRSRIEEYSWIQTGDAPQLSLLRPQVISNQTCNVSTDAVTDKMYVVGQHATRMPSQVLNQLCNAQTAEARCPFHLTETWFFDQAAIVDNNDIIVAALKVCLTYVRTRIVVATATETVYDDFGWMRSIEMRVVERLGIEYVEKFGLLLGASRV